MISKLNLNSSIEINSATSDVSSVLLESSIYAITSKYEGFCLTLTEAMAHGVPPVSYDCKSSPAEIIKNGEDGLLVPLNNKKIFIQKLSFLIENEKLRKLMGKAASQNILRYSLDNVMQKWIDLFERLISS